MNDKKAIRETDGRRGPAGSMRDHARARVARFAPSRSWHERSAALGHLALFGLAGLAVANILVLLPLT